MPGNSVMIFVQTFKEFVTGRIFIEIFDVKVLNAKINPLVSNTSRQYGMFSPN